MAYYALEPFGEQRADLRSGIIAATIANRHRDPKREKKLYQAAGFMPQFWREEPDKSAVVQKLDEVFGAMAEGGE